VSGFKTWMTTVQLNGLTPAWVSGVVMAVAALILVSLATVLRARHRPGPATAPTATRSWLRVLASLLVAAAVILIAKVLIEDVWKPFPDPVPWPTWAMIYATVAAIAVAVPAMGRRRGRGIGRRIGRGVVVVASVVMMLGGTLTQINLQYSAFPNLGGIFGIEGYASEPAQEALVKRENTVALGAGQTFENLVPTDWTAPGGGRPSRGVVTQVDIPATASGFRARPAEVYLPPAYFASTRPELPVVVMMAGIPGGPDDWTNSVQMPQVLDGFAAAHNGVAPIVVVADPTGERLGNTLCVDSPRGNADTYLATDVPNWIEGNLQASEDKSNWMIGGLSFGATCSVQLSLAHPALYPNFLALSPQVEPTIGTRQETLDAFFAGDPAAFAAHNPIDIMAKTQFPTLRGAFAVGTEDQEFRPGTETLAAAAEKAGIDTQLKEVPGGHNFALWHRSLEEYLPWLAQTLRLA